MLDTASPRLSTSPSVWHEINPRQGKGTQRFYTQLFGWTTTDVDMGPMGAYTLFQQDKDSVGGIVRMNSPEWDGLPPHWSVYVQVDNVDSRAQKAEELGGKVCVPPFDIPKIGRACVILDPEGASFYLFAPRRAKSLPVKRGCYSMKWPLTILLLTCSAHLVAANKPPGVVIDHSPASSGLYIGSPGLAILPNGDYVASHDFFGPNSDEHKSARSVVFRSRNRGKTWKQTAEIQGAFWSTLFVHDGKLYLLGTDRHHGNIVIRCSTDNGANWTTPTKSTDGLLRDGGEHHCGPMPVLVHNGRLWRAFEWRDPPIAWGSNYRTGMMSAPVDADLLDAANWTFSDFLPSDRSWNGKDMGAWLEGNAVVAPDGSVVDFLRVQTKSPDEKAAIVHISADGKTVTFDPEKDFVKFPGGAKKFTVRYDPKSKQYWSLASIVHDQHRANNPGSIRNTLALTSSPDLVNWSVRCILLYHPDVKKHGFQYVEWLFEGNDIIAACRTAFDDEAGGAKGAHDANYLTFHRFNDFRKLTMMDSVVAPKP